MFHGTRYGTFYLHEYSGQEDEKVVVLHLIFIIPNHNSYILYLCD